MENTYGNDTLSLKMKRKWTNLNKSCLFFHRVTNRKTLLPVQFMKELVDEMRAQVSLYKDGARCHKRREEVTQK